MARRDNRYCKLKANQILQLLMENESDGGKSILITIPRYGYRIMGERYYRYFFKSNQDSHVTN